MTTLATVVTAREASTLPLPPEATVVVVGGGHGGAAVLAQLRARGFAGRLVLVTAEAALPYHRPPLSKKALGAPVDTAVLAIRPAGWYAEQRIETWLSTQALAIDREHRRLQLRGEGAPAELVYDALVLATGAAPRRLPGAPTSTHELRDAADAAALGTALRSARSLLVIGGGYVGLEVAASARRLGLEVAVVEQAPRILQRVAPEPTARALRELHQAQGVRVLEGAEVLSIDGAGARVRTADGDEQMLAADVVLAGIGAVPRDGLARDCGLAVDDGIVVDAACRTSDPVIWAIGDVARVVGRPLRLESVANANEQGAQVAAALCGAPVPAPGVPWFWSEQYDGRLQIAGLWQGADRWVVRNEGQGLSVWSFQGDRLLAVDAWQAPQAYVMGKKWLEAGLAPGPDWLQDGHHALKDWNT